MIPDGGIISPLGSERPQFLLREVCNPRAADHIARFVGFGLIFLLEFAPLGLNVSLKLY